MADSPPSTPSFASAPASPVPPRAETPAADAASDTTSAVVPYEAGAVRAKPKSRGLALSEDIVRDTANAMRPYAPWLGGCVVLAFATFSIVQLLMMLLVLVLLVAAVGLGYFLATPANAKDKPQLARLLVEDHSEFVPRSLNRLRESKEEGKTFEFRAFAHTPLAISTRIDGALGTFFDFMVRDFVYPWYAPISGDQPFLTHVRQLLDNIAMNFSTRANETDLATISTYRLMHALIVHLREYRIAEEFDGGVEEYFATTGQSYLHFAATGSANEITYLRELADLVLANLLPPSECASGTVRLLLREIIACQVLAPVMEMMCDPDNVNQWMLAALRGSPQTDTADRLRITVADAQGFPPMDEHDMSRPFCVVVVGDQQARTRKTDRTTESPVWNETFVLPVKREADGSILVTVDAYDWDPFKNDMYIGSIMMKVKDLEHGRTVRDWHPLRTNGTMRAVGNAELQLEMTLLKWDWEETARREAIAAQEAAVAAAAAAAAQAAASAAGSPASLSRRSTSAGLSSVPKVDIVIPGDLGAGEMEQTPSGGLARVSSHGNSLHTLGRNPFDDFDGECDLSDMTGALMPLKPVQLPSTVSPNRTAAAQPTISVENADEEEDDGLRMLQPSNSVGSIGRAATSPGGHRRVPSMGKDARKDGKRDADVADEAAPPKFARSLDDALHNNDAFMYFMDYMERRGGSNWLQLWVNAENFRQSIVTASPEMLRDEEFQQNCRQEAFSIFTMHFAPGAPYHVRVDKSVVVALEGALKDRTEDGLSANSFLRVQEIAYRRMKENYFPKFRRSRDYKAYTKEWRLVHGNDPPVSDDSDSDGGGGAGSGAVAVVGPGASNPLTNTFNTLTSIVNRVGFGSNTNLAGLSTHNLDAPAPNSASVSRESLFDDEELQPLPAVTTSVPMPKERRAARTVSAPPGGVALAREIVNSTNGIYSYTGAATTPEQRRASQSLADSIAYDHAGDIGTNDALKIFDKSTGNLLWDGFDPQEQHAVGAAIAMVREQQALLTNKIEELANVAAQTDNKKDLMRAERQVKHLQEQIAELDKEAINLRSMTALGEDRDVHTLTASVTGFEIDTPAKSKPRTLYIIEVESSGGDKERRKGWVTMRTYAEFQELHTRLRGRFAKVRHMDLPVQKSSKGSELIRVALDHYLNQMLSDSLLSKTSDVREFLQPLGGVAMPSRDHVQAVSAQENLANTVKQRLKALREKRRPSEDGEGLKKGNRADLQAAAAVALAPQSSKGDKGDSVSMGGPESDGDLFMAEDASILLDTVLAVVDEVFDLNDRNHWLRRQAMYVFKQVLQQAYGSAINRHIVENMRWLTEEPQIAGLIERLTRTMWPEGRWPSGGKRERTDEEKERTRAEAKNELVRRMPDALMRMVGRYNSVRGITRIFDMLQHPRLNRHLVYVTMDAFVVSLFAGKRENERAPSAPPSEAASPRQSMDVERRSSTLSSGSASVAATSLSA